MGSDQVDYSREEAHSALSLVLNAFAEVATGVPYAIIEDSPSSARIVFEDSGITVRLRAEKTQQDKGGTPWHRQRS